MAFLFGKEMTRREIERRVGEIGQIAWARRKTLMDGQGDGVHTIEMNSGAGLRFEVLPSRSMEIGHASYRGMPIAWTSKVDTASPAYFHPYGTDWLRTFGGGLIANCGLTTAGNGSFDDGEELPLHGWISGAPAEEVSAGGHWEGDDYILTASGSARQAIALGENLRLTRKITMKAGENCFTVDDCIENLGFSPRPLVFIYHMNFGFPFLEGTSKVYVTSDETVPSGPATYGKEDLWPTAQEPTPDFVGRGYLHRCVPDENGQNHAMLHNPKRNLAVLLSFDHEPFCRLTEYQMLGEGDYYLALEPATNRSWGRDKERQHGTLREILPGQSVQTHLCVSILDGEDAIKQAMRHFERTGR